ncbi:MAG: DUF2148 domain-containing protein [Anaerostipes sp.]|nr:DUF2148 domain-containing protein [Anaerostipes sp.]MDD4372051.1 DUF2148 domain-containing protein [Anaerostipes sp.]
MIYKSEEIEYESLMETAKAMCVAARTAPKARGVDFIHTMIVTGNQLEEIVEQTKKFGVTYGQDFCLRDGENLRKSAALVLIGVSYHQRGLNECCQYCNYTNCAECAKEDGVCVYDPLDLGIAIGSAVSIASMAHVDNRVMFSLGKGAMELGIMGDKVKMVMGIPLSVSGKAPYFDRK